VQNFLHAMPIEPIHIRRSRASGAVSDVGIGGREIFAAVWIPIRFAIFSFWRARLQKERDLRPITICRFADV
jgi:hypothetical protein